MSGTKRVHVAVAVIRQPSKHGANILISKRADDAHQGGLWEFPGGKVESYETVQQALKRELNEELGIDIRSDISPLIQIRHDYSEKHVFLDVWNVDGFEGDARGCEGQPLQWVSPTALSDLDFPEANKPIIDAVCLGRRYLITPQFDCYEDLASHLSQAESKGFDLIQLRQHHLNDELYISWASKLYQQFPNVRLVWNRTLRVMASLPGDAWHLNAEQARQAKHEGYSLPYLFGVSCHSKSELALAESVGANYALLSPVQRTQSHPDAEPLGLANFEALLEGCNIPVYALGGMRDEQLGEVIRAGGQGIAGISTWQTIIEGTR
ncbi:hypothetical protein A3715_29205 [Oleiphilus sp. HI0009]|uniref:Nudix family hydrolase n=2 Tax=Oleiphilus TaxID=141450 RepID=UPI0007C28A88|nr:MULTISPECIES: Nudix family hydrolase [unclassified Oleiphilus]KZX81390.1 hypothetical protein A3715_07620 [Oleiphilus sp. HI0009]MCH2159631.1 Nudix family hydrolase [Oleiphilaceae bacterium]KZX84826.1 hypothetical protein A3715_29205 [Oleiphilus sp. HI0009]KZY65786.1 hypothetical protein A3738_07865 [Oleiphilus sp. HI0066]KZY75560.1 hypothetical protein A3739_02270 [Oleiphilus sp. HI0067]